MPELPEVEHVVRALRKVIVGRAIVASEVRLPKLIAPLSAAAFNRKIKNATIGGVSRRGKFILIELARHAALPDGRASDTSRRRASILAAKPAQRVNRLILAVHLRMTGKFVLLNQDDQLTRHSHAIFYLDHDQRLVFRDQRQFGVMKLIEPDKLSQTKGISELAPEPFGDEFSLDYLRALVKRSHRSLKTLLLDQTKVLGLGNIYAAEALFRARINPFKSADELSSRRVPALHQAIREVLQFAVDHIRESINLEETFSYGAAFERFWQVYEREGEPCVRCGAKIRRATHGGRSTYWCPKCQRR
jgi:formamidopyrimidine-DNA glycosylase